MVKFFFKFFLIVLAIFVSGAIFLSYFGLETNKFDNLIQNKANEINQNVKLEFYKTKIYLTCSFSFSLISTVVLHLMFQSQNDISS